MLACYFRERVLVCLELGIIQKGLSKMTPEHLQLLCLVFAKEFIAMDQDGDQFQTSIPSIGNSVNRDRNPCSIDIAPMPFIEEHSGGELQCECTNHLGGKIYGNVYTLRR